MGAPNNKYKGEGCKGLPIIKPSFCLSMTMAIAKVEVDGRNPEMLSYQTSQHDIIRYLLWNGL